MEYKYKAKKVNGKRIDEHRLIYEANIGRKLLTEEIIHHIDGNKRNNNIENLMLFENKSEHTKFHIKNGDLKLLSGSNKKQLIDGKLLCCHCKKLKKLKEFQKRKSAHLGVTSICLDCRNEQVILYKLRKSQTKID